jgi:hypothetical protein
MTIGCVIGPGPTSIPLGPFDAIGQIRRSRRPIPIERGSPCVFGASLGLQQICAGAHGEGCIDLLRRRLLRQQYALLEPSRKAAQVQRFCVVGCVRNTSAGKSSFSP